MTAAAVGKSTLRVLGDLLGKVRYLPSKVLGYGKIIKYLGQTYFTR